MIEIIRNCLRHKLRNLLMFVQMTLVFAYLMTTVIFIQRAFNICIEVPGVLGDGWQGVVHCEISDDEEDVQQLHKLNDYLEENEIMDRVASFDVRTMCLGESFGYNEVTNFQMELGISRIADFKIQSGRNFCEEDLHNGRLPALVGSELAERCDIKIGDTFEDSYSQTEYEVIGTLKNNSYWFGQSFSDGVICPLDNQVVTLMSGKKSDEYVRLHYYGKVNGSMAAGQAAERINDFSRDSGFTLRAVSIEDELDEQYHIILKDNIGWLISSIVIMIMVAIGTASLAAANLYAKRKEVGIRMAVGYPPAKVIRLFIGEIMLIVFAAYGTACLFEYISVGNGIDALGTMQMYSGFAFTGKIALLGAAGAVIMCIPSLIALAIMISRFRPKNLIGGKE